MRSYMESGYFDYDHIETAAEAIAQLRSCREAYAAINPFNPAKNKSIISDIEQKGSKHFRRSCADPNFYQT